MAELRCPSCGAPALAGALFCQGCGASLQVRAVEGQPACAVHPDRQALRPCPRCGSFACAQCLRTTPSGEERCAACEARAPAELLPWDRREELGTLRAFFQTGWLLIQKPTVTFERVSPRASVGSSLLYCALSSLALILTTLVLYGVGFGAVFAFGLSKGEAKGLPGGLAAVGIGLGVFVFYLVMVVAYGMVSALALSGLEHLMLKLLGVKPLGWEVSLRAHCLGMAPYLVGLVPVCGLYVAPIWALVLRILAYKAFHKTTGGKAAGAVLIPIGAFVCLAVAGYAALFAMLMAVNQTGK